MGFFDKAGEFLAKSVEKHEKNVQFRARQFEKELSGTDRNSLSSDEKAKYDQKSRFIDKASSMDVSDEADGIRQWGQVIDKTINPPKK